MFIVIPILITLFHYKESHWFMVHQYLFWFQFSILLFMVISSRILHVFKVLSRLSNCFYIFMCEFFFLFLLCMCSCVCLFAVGDNSCLKVGFPQVLFCFVVVSFPWIHLSFSHFSFLLGHCLSSFNSPSKGPQIGNILYNSEAVHIFRAEANTNNLSTFQSFTILCFLASPSMQLLYLLQPYAGK